MRKAGGVALSRPTRLDILNMRDRDIVTLIWVIAVCIGLYPILLAKFGGFLNIIILIIVLILLIRFLINRYNNKYPKCVHGIRYGINECSQCKKIIEDRQVILKNEQRQRDIKQKAKAFILNEIMKFKRASLQNINYLRRISPR